MHDLKCAGDNEAFLKWTIIWDGVVKAGLQCRIDSILHQMVLDQTIVALLAVWMVCFLQLNVPVKKQEYQSNISGLHASTAGEW